MRKWLSILMLSGLASLTIGEPLSRVPERMIDTRPIAQWTAFRPATNTLQSVLTWLDLHLADYLTGVQGPAGVDGVAGTMNPYQLADLTNAWLNGRSATNWIGTNTVYRDATNAAYQAVLAGIAGWEVGSHTGLLTKAGGANGTTSLGTIFVNGQATNIGALTPWTALGYLSTETQTLQQVLDRGSSAPTNNITISNATFNGNVGVGSAPGANALHVAGNMDAYNVYADGLQASAWWDTLWARTKITLSNTNGIIFYGQTNDTGDVVERMRMTTSGNFGIGTNAPSQSLDVNGSAIIRSNLTVTGSILGSSFVVTTSNGLTWIDCGASTGFVFRFTGPGGVTNVYLP